MSQFIIENQFLKASFDALGAELQSLIKIENKAELIWQAKQEYWPRHAPILFPIVGRLKDNTYTYKGVKYEMNQHGFARDAVFKVEHHTQTEIVFLLTENKNTLTQFPFKFEFRVIYTLNGLHLNQAFSVVNTNITNMHCSFGGHPAFNANPIHSYQLKFTPTNSNQLLYLLKEGSIGSIGNHFEMNTLALSETLFDADALIFEKTNDLIITLMKNETPILAIATCDMPYLGIWSKPTAPFVCIEPWQGWADLDTHTGEIELKSGIVEIEAGKQCNRKFEIRVY
jgi:galactose mutarotase-like enzyme